MLLSAIQALPFKWSKDHDKTKTLLYRIYNYFLSPLFSPLSGEARELRGKVYILGFNDELNAVKNTPVRIEETDNSDVTTDTGGFRIFLPDSFKAGEEVTLKVEKTGYEILYPPLGKARIPAEPLKDLVQIKLDKPGSHRFMSHEQFALLIKDIADKAKAQVKADAPRKELDLSLYLKEWAVKYGFGIDEVRAELDRWASDIETRQDNFYELGLAAFYKKNFQEGSC